MRCSESAASCCRIPYHYRDRRTEGVMEEVFRKVSKEEIYRATGIQFMPINTLVSTFRRTTRYARTSWLQRTHLLTIPDLFNYWLTGNAVCEFTNATTTQMVDPVTRTWASELDAAARISRLHLPAPIVEPGLDHWHTLVRHCADSSLAGTPVIAPACHDTGSAVAAISAREGTAFLSSGTWSLVGTELDSPVITREALRSEFHQ